MRDKGFFHLRQFVNFAILWLYLSTFSRAMEVPANRLPLEDMATVFRARSNGVAVQDARVTQATMDFSPNSLEVGDMKTETQGPSHFRRLEDHLQAVLEQAPNNSEEEVQKIGKELKRIFACLDPSIQTPLSSSAAADRHHDTVALASSSVREPEQSHTGQSGLHSVEGQLSGIKVSPISGERPVRANLAFENGQNVATNMSEKAWQTAVLDLWSIIIRAFETESQRSRGVVLKVNSLDVQYSRKLKDAEEDVFKRKRWSEYIKGERTPLSEPAPMSITGATTSIAWGLLDYLVGDKIFNQRAIEQIIPQRNEYEAMLQDFIVEQMAASSTLDPFFDRQDFQLFVREHPNLRHISNLLEGMRPQSWKTLELSYLERYLEFYQEFPFHSDKIRQDVLFNLEVLLEHIRAGEVLSTTCWTKSGFGTNFTLNLSHPRSLDTYIVYHIYLYQAFKYSQKYLPDLFSFDDQLVRRMEQFGKEFRAIQETVHFWKIVTPADIILNYKILEEPFTTLFFFQKKVVPFLFKKIKPSTNSYFEYTFPQELKVSVNIQKYTIGICGWLTSSRSNQILQEWESRIGVVYDRLKAAYSALNTRVESSANLLDERDDIGFLFHSREGNALSSDIAKKVEKIKESILADNQAFVSEIRNLCENLNKQLNIEPKSQESLAIDHKTHSKFSLLKTFS